MSMSAGDLQATWPLRAVPLRHGDPTLLQGPWWTTWRIDPSIALGIFGLIVAYTWAVGSANRRRGAEAQPVSVGQRLCFYAGCVALLLALGPPLEDWAELLLSMHMTQHVLLTLVAPPLLLLGTPAWMLRPLLRWRVIARVGYVLTRPLMALGLSGAVFLLWHMPPLYDASLRVIPLHVFQHLLYIATGLLAWWPIVGPLPEWPRPAPPVQCLYLFAQTLPGGIVGSFITMSQPGLYPFYQSVPRMWALDVATDQQIGGLLMWVGVNTVYLLLTAVVFFRWAGREEEKERNPRRDPSNTATGWNLDRQSALPRTEA